MTATLVEWHSAETYMMWGSKQCKYLWGVHSGPRQFLAQNANMRQQKAQCLWKWWAKASMLGDESREAVTDQILQVLIGHCKICVFYSKWDQENHWQNFEQSDMSWHMFQQDLSGCCVHLRLGGKNGNKEPSDGIYPGKRWWLLRIEG